MDNNNDDEDRIIAIRITRRQTTPRERHLSLTTLENQVVRQVAKVVKRRKMEVEDSMLMLSFTTLIAAYKTYRRSRVGWTDSIRRQFMLCLLMLTTLFLDYDTRLLQIKHIQRNYVDRFGLRARDFRPENYTILPKINRSFNTISDVDCNR